MFAGPELCLGLGEREPEGAVRALPGRGECSSSLTYCEHKERSSEASWCSSQLAAHGGSWCSQVDGGHVSFSVLMSLNRSYWARADKRPKVN